MQSRITAAVFLITTLAASAGTTPAQTRPHDTVMKEVAATFSSLSERLDSAAFSAAAGDAARLRDLFQEIEAFWAVFETRDAIEFAQDAQRGSEEVITAAGEENAGNARRSYSSIQATCGGCHDSHRESMPDGSFRIKP